MFGIGMTELLVIFVVGLLVLGPKRLPELASSLGKGLAELKRASREAKREFLDAGQATTGEPAPRVEAEILGQPSGPSGG